jgi:hypothetical protein
MACSTQEQSHSIQYFKSKNLGTYLNLSSFHFENEMERCYSSFKINDSIYDEDKLDDLVLNVKPGDVDIIAGSVGKDWIKTKIMNVRKGDSLVIQFYLKNTKETSNHGPY